MTDEAKALLVACALAVTLAVTSCAQSGVTVAQVTSTSATPVAGEVSSAIDPSTTSTTLPGAGTTTPGAIRDAIAQSGRAPAGFEVEGSVISGDWAGAVVTDSQHERVALLLYHDGAKGWAVVDVGHSFFLSPELATRGVPKQVAAFIACDT